MFTQRVTILALLIDSSDLEDVAIRLQVKHLLKVDSLEIIWSSSFLLLTLKKFLRKSFLVRNIYCTCSGTSLLHFLTRAISLESNRSSMILHVTRKNEKKDNFWQGFFKAIKKEFLLRLSS